MCYVLETNLMRKFAADLSVANLFNSLYLKVRLWWNISSANLATNFQDLVAKVKNFVALAPVLGAISRLVIDCIPPLPKYMAPLDKVVQKKLVQKMV